MQKRHESSIRGGGGAAGIVGFGHQNPTKPKLPMLVSIPSTRAQDASAGTCKNKRIQYLFIHKKAHVYKRCERLAQLVDGQAHGIGLVTIHFCIHRVSLCHVEIPQAVMIRIRCRFGVQTVPPQESRRHARRRGRRRRRRHARLPLLLLLLLLLPACVRACVRRMCTTFFLLARVCISRTHAPTTPHGRETMNRLCRCCEDGFMSYRY
jgi:hypothetical protein